MSSIKNLINVETRGLNTSEDILYTSDTIISEIINSGNYITIEIEHTQSKRFRGDFFGLLNTLKVPTEFFYITMILNKLPSSESFSGDTTSIYLVEESFLNSLISLLAD